MNDRVFILQPSFAMKMRILHAVDRPLTDITVHEICEKCGISRQTFYYHFQSKQDIAYWHADLCQQLYLDEIGRTLGWSEALHSHFAMLAEERTFYQFVVTHANPHPGDGARMIAHREQTLLETLAEYHGIADPTPTLRFCVRVYAHVESTFAIQWFRRGMDIDPAEFAEMIEAIVPAELHAALDRAPMKRPATPPVMTRLSGRPRVTSDHDRSPGENSA